MTSLNDLLTSHFGFKIDLDYLEINTSTEDLYTEDGFKKLIEHVASKIDAIKKNPYLAYYYSLYVIKDRWSEAEEIIKKDPEWAYEYSRYVIKDRWSEAEEVNIINNF
jgi:hypothetical protein